MSEESGMDNLYFLISQLWLIGSFLITEPVGRICMVIMGTLFFAGWIYIIFSNEKPLPLPANKGNLDQKSKGDQGGVGN